MAASMLVYPSISSNPPGITDFPHEPGFGSHYHTRSGRHFTLEMSTRSCVVKLRPTFGCRHNAPPFPFLASWAFFGFPGLHSVCGVTLGLNLYLLTGQFIVHSVEERIILQSGMVVPSPRHIMGVWRHSCPLLLASTSAPPRHWIHT